MIIYKITNLINNKIYIGQTTQELKQRIQNYKEEIKFSNTNRPIIMAMRKYGFNNFLFEILEDNISTKEDLDQKEIYYIKNYQSLINQKGYNVENGGNSVGKHSEETKKKISEAQLGPLNHMYGKTGKLNATSKPVIELTTGKTFESANLAANHFNLSFSHICAVARGEEDQLVKKFLDI